MHSKAISINKKRAIFLDLQGTLGGNGFDDITTFVFYPFSFSAIKYINKFGYRIIIVTNQSHISKGIISELQYDEYKNKLLHEASDAGAHIDAFYCCPHSQTDNCNCRKPKPGLFKKAETEFEIILEESYVVGDSGVSDMKAAKSIGAKAILVLSGIGRGSIGEYRSTWSDIEPNYIAENVLEAAKWIIEDGNRKNESTDSGRIQT